MYKSDEDALAAFEFSRHDVVDVEDDVAQVAGGGDAPLATV